MRACVRGCLRDRHHIRRLYKLTRRRGPGREASNFRMEISICLVFWTSS
jgi:hypothetical protein